jgi:hypothetical protein
MRRLVVPPGVTVALVLFAVPHRLLIRTQYVACAFTAWMYSRGELPPTGVVKSKTGPWYQRYSSDVPVADTPRNAVDPGDTVAPCGCETIAGATQDGTTVTAAAFAELAVPQSFVARSQNDREVVIGPTATVAVVALRTGFDVSPTLPSNHCSRIGCVPTTVADNVYESPLEACPLDGCTTIAGASQGTTVTVIVALSAKAPQEFVARIQ